MEYLLLYSIGLSLVSFLGMVLTKPASIPLPPHQDSDEADVAMSESQISIPLSTSYSTQSVPTTERSAPYFQPAYVSEEEAFVIPHAISDYARY